MYCYTYVSNINCIFNELVLWSEITSEHPIFIMTVAQLTNKILPQEIKNRLTDINKEFSALKDRAESLRKSITKNPNMSHKFIGEINGLINTFILHDKHILSLLPEIMQIGKEDKVWQELLEHIGQEQTFMYEIFTNISSQISPAQSK